MPRLNTQERGYKFISTLVAVVALIPSILSSIVTVVHLYWDYKKSQEPPKDEAWETAVQFYLADQKSHGFTTDDFARIYNELRFLKEHWEEMREHQTIQEAIAAYKDKQLQQSDTSQGQAE